MRNIILCCLVTVLSLIACQPEKSFDRKEEQTSLEDFYKKNQSSFQSFSISSSSGGTATTSRNIKVYFPANGFVTNEGSPVSGNISIDVKEIFTPSEMILNSMPTMSGGLPLESGGEFQIKATKNGESLKLSPGKFLRIQFPSTQSINMNGMEVFNGVADSRGNVDWSLNTNPGNFVVRDSMFLVGTTASLFCDKTEWINCDKFINEPVVEFSVVPANAPSNDSTNVFVHLTGRNSVVKMNWTQGLSYFNSGKLLAVPSTIIGISVKNGQLYASITPVIVRNGESVTMNFSPYSETELKQKLSLLH
jgi:hypothetical protein